MTPDKVRTVAPEFADDDDATIQFFLDWAQRLNSPAAWGAAYGDAMACLAAHLKTIADQGDPTSSGAGPGAGMGAVGPAVSVAVGRWSMSFGGNLTGAESGLDPAGDGSLVTTRHGKLFLMMRRTRVNGRSKLIRPKGTY